MINTNNNNKYLCTYEQMAILTIGKVRDYTINIGFKLNKKLNDELLLKAFNLELERNEGLRVTVFNEKKDFYSVVTDPYKLDSITTHDYSTKTIDEVKEFINTICATEISFEKATVPYEIHHIKCDDDTSFLLFRILHCVMDTMALLMTVIDCLSIYFALEEGKEIPENKFTSVEKYLANYDNKKEFGKVDDDTKWFIEKFSKDGEPTYLGFDERTKNHKGKRFFFNTFKDRKTKIKSLSINKETFEKIKKHCEASGVAIPSLFMSTLGVYYSSINNKATDYLTNTTTSLRAKLSDKKLPFNMTNGLLYRCLLDMNESYNDYVSKHNENYMLELKHCHIDSMATVKLFLKYRLLAFQPQYSQIMFTFVPMSFEGLPKDITIEPYWPSGVAYDSMIYDMTIPSTDGGLTSLYRYYVDFLNDDDITKLHEGFVKTLNICLDNSDLSLNDIIDKCNEVK